MAPADNLSPAGSSTYSSNTMYVGDGTWDATRNTFLLPNLVGLNFETMRYNGISILPRSLLPLEIIELNCTNDGIANRNGQPIQRSTAVSYINQRPWNRRSHYIPLHCSGSHYDSEVLWPVTRMGLTIPHLPTNPHRSVDDGCIYAWLVCCGPEAKSDESASWHRSHNLCFDLGSGHWRGLDTQTGEGESEEKATNQIGAASMAWESNCNFGNCSGPSRTYALRESEVYFRVVYPLDDLFVGVVFCIELQSNGADWRCGV